MLSCSGGSFFLHLEFPSWHSLLPRHYHQLLLLLLWSLFSSIFHYCSPAYPLTKRFSSWFFSTYNLFLCILSVRMVSMKYAGISKQLSPAPTSFSWVLDLNFQLPGDICTWIYQRHPKLYTALLASGILCSSLMNNLSFWENIKEVNTFDKPSLNVTSSVKSSLTSSYP